MNDNAVFFVEYLEKIFLWTYKVGFGEERMNYFHKKYHYLELEIMKCRYQYIQLILVYENKKFIN